MDRCRLRSSVNDLKDEKFYRALLAEFLGIFILVYVGCGAANEMVEADALAIAVTFGLTLAIVGWTLGHASGAHINPAGMTSSPCPPCPP